MTVYNKGMSERWTIGQLAALVEKALQTAGYNGQGSGRVRSLPDLRTIRYYTTIGLLDPPAEMRGRKACYGRRHVLQLVAIKRLQSRGMALVQVQESMVGANDSALGRWAALPADFWERSATIVWGEQRPLAPDAVLAVAAGMAKTATPSVPRRRGHFWAATPDLSAVPSPLASVEQQGPRQAVHLAVADGVELVVAGIDASKLDRHALGRLSPILKTLAQVLYELQQSPAPPQPESEGGPDISSSSNPGK